MPNFFTKSLMSNRRCRMDASIVKCWWLSGYFVYPLEYGFYIIIIFGPHQWYYFDAGRLIDISIYNIYTIFWHSMSFVCYVVTDIFLIFSHRYIIAQTLSHLTAKNDEIYVSTKSPSHLESLIHFVKIIGVFFRNFTGIKTHIYRSLR